MAVPGAKPKIRKEIRIQDSGALFCFSCFHTGFEGHIFPWTLEQLILGACQSGGAVVFADVAAVFAKSSGSAPFMHDFGKVSTSRRSELMLCLFCLSPDQIFSPVPLKSLCSLPGSLSSALQHLCSSCTAREGRFGDGLVPPRPGEEQVALEWSIPPQITQGVCSSPAGWICLAQPP